MLHPLLSCQPAGRFKPSMLEAALGQLLKSNEAKTSYAVSKHVSVKMFLAWAVTQILVMLEHTRRLQNTKLRQQAVRHLTIDETTALDALLAQLSNAPSPSPTKARAPAATPSTPPATLQPD
eukprot:13372518-Alexandrium_andersonii.AAC.1